MAVGDILVGLDIGFSDMNLLVVRVNDFNQLDIIVKKSEKINSFNKNYRLNKEEISKKLSKILKEIEEEKEFKIKSSYVNIPGIYIDVHQKENIIDIKNPLKGISEDDIFKIIENLRENNSKLDYTDIDILPYKFVLDNGKYIENPIGEYSKSLVMFSQIIFGSNEYIDDVFDIFDSLDLMVDGFIPIGLGQSEVFTNAYKYKNSFLIIDFNKKNIEISLFINGAFVYTNTLKTGIDAIIKLIAYNLEIDEEEAEILLKQYPLALKSYVENDNNILLKTSKAMDYNKRTIKTSQLIEIIEDTLNKIFQKINKDITKLGYKKLLDLIILTGEILNINKSDTLAMASFNINVKKEKKQKYFTDDEKFFSVYSILKYISKDKNLNLECSSLIEQKENKKTLKTIFKNIKDFFYS